MGDGVPRRPAAPDRTTIFKGMFREPPDAFFRTWEDYAVEYGERDFFFRERRKLVRLPSFGPPLDLSRHVLLPRRRRGQTIPPRGADKSTMRDWHREELGISSAVAMRGAAPTAKVSRAY